MCGDAWHFQWRKCEAMAVVRAALLFALRHSTTVARMLEGQGRPGSRERPCAHMSLKSASACRHHLSTWEAKSVLPLCVRLTSSPRVSFWQIPLAVLYRAQVPRSCDRLGRLAFRSRPARSTPVRVLRRADPLARLGPALGSELLEPSQAVSVGHFCTLRAYLTAGECTFPVSVPCF